VVQWSSGRVRKERDRGGEDSRIPMAGGGATNGGGQRPTASLRGLGPVIFPATGWGTRRVTGPAACGIGDHAAGRAPCRGAAFVHAPAALQAASVVAARTHVTVTARLHSSVAERLMHRAAPRAVPGQAPGRRW
jgi:hypothetical protein